MEKFSIMPTRVTSTTNENREKILPTGATSNNTQMTRNQGPVFDGRDVPRVLLNSYPKTGGRSFRKEWYNLFPWLLYDVEKDMVTCYVCHNYGTDSTKLDHFSKTGFRNWKKALDKDKGFNKHEKSQAHVSSVLKWAEKYVRQNKNLEVCSLVNETVLEKNRYYVTSIFDIMRFVVSQELPLRGTYDTDNHIESGLFQSMFKFTLQKDIKLMDCVKQIPKNASYQSPDIQNEIISIMAKCVKKKLSTTIRNADVPFFSVMVDGTRDRNNAEAISICMRYVLNGVPTESLLSIENAESLKAECCANLILSVFAENDIDSSCLLSQCYDGAAVMSGNRGGVQALVQQKLNRSVPYVHCYNHQLHLVVLHVISQVPEVEQYFDYCRVIHKVFSTFNFKEFYDGSRTTRLMDQRWAGHLKVTEIIYANYSRMISALEAFLSQDSSKKNGAEIVESRGLLCVMKTETFTFTLCAILKLLRLVNPADQVLQTKEIGLAKALPVIRTVYSCAENCRSDETFMEVFSDHQSLQPENDPTGLSSDLTIPVKRKIRVSSKLNDFRVTQSTGIRHHDNFKQLYFQIFDVVLMEFRRRFLEHDLLISAIDLLSSFQLDDIKPEHFDLISSLGIVVPSMEELKCVKSFFDENGIDKNDYLSKLFEFKLPFKNTYQMLAALATFGCSSARCECSFSVLNRILSKFRQSMNFSREADLTLLAFEKKILQSISNEDLLRVFNGQINRRLQLF